MRTRLITPTEHWKIALWVDNDQALSKTSWIRLAAPKHQLMPESDLIADIITVRDEIQLNIRGQHVHSHQNITENEITPLEVILNEACDKQAKEYLHHAPPEMITRPSAAISPTAIASLSINKQLITNNYHRRLLNAHSSADMTTYLKERNAWNQRTFESVDWEHLEAAILPIKKHSKHKFARIVKFMINMPNTGRQKHKYTRKAESEPTTTAACPCCKTAKETTMHLYQCPDPKLHELLSLRLRELLDTLQKRHITKDIWHSMSAGINSFRTSTDPALHEARSAEIGHAFKQQTDIGWSNFLKGRVAVEWGHLMLQEYQTKHKNKRHETRRKFQTTLITGLWDIYGMMWKHRCSSLHDHTDITSLSNIDLNAKIRFYYENRLNLLGIGDQDHFSTGLQSTLQTSITQKIDWIITIAHRVRSHTRDIATLLETIPTLHTYFT